VSRFSLTSLSNAAIPAIAVIAVEDDPNKTSIRKGGMEITQCAKRR